MNAMACVILSYAHEFKVVVFFVFVISGFALALFLDRRSKMENFWTFVGNFIVGGGLLAGVLAAMAIEKLLERLC